MPGDWLKNCIRWKKKKKQNQYQFCLHLCLENLLGFYHNHHRTVIQILAIWPHTFFVEWDQENYPGCKFKKLLVLQLVQVSILLNAASQMTSWHFSNDSITRSYLKGSGELEFFCFHHSLFYLEHCRDFHLKLSSSMSIKWVIAFYYSLDTINTQN